jgi:hypothetical protein
MTNSEAVHKAGAHRHTDRWLFANRRAIEAAQAAGIDYRDEKTKIAIALITLKVLDGQMADTGFVWSNEGEKWIPRKTVEIAKRLVGATG